MRLTEIEAELGHWYDGHLPIEYQHIDLLVRAVRQFGAYYKHSHPLLSEQVGINPDVLELLDETD